MWPPASTARVSPPSSRRRSTARARMATPAASGIYARAAATTNRMHDSATPTTAPITTATCCGAGWISESASTPTFGATIPVFSPVTSSRGVPSHERTETHEPQSRSVAVGGGRRACRRSAGDGERRRLLHDLRSRLGSRPVRRRRVAVPTHGGGSVRLFRSLLVARAGAGHHEHLSQLGCRQAFGRGRLARPRQRISEEMKRRASMSRPRIRGAWIGCVWAACAALAASLGASRCAVAGDLIVTGAKPDRLFVIDATTRTVRAEHRIPGANGLVSGILISPDQKIAYILVDR